jgi:putative transposase
VVTCPWISVRFRFNPYGRHSLERGNPDFPWSRWLKVWIPAFAHECPGKVGFESKCRGMHARQIRVFLILSGCRDTERQTGMRFVSSIFTSLLKPIDRRRFRASVARHGADAYGKSFNSWEHCVALVFAQLSGASSLRALETGFNAQSNHHYHLGCGQLSRSTLADANRRRPVAVFTDVFQGLVGQLGRKARSQARDVLHLIDSTPIMLGDMFECATSNGRIRGFKLHVLHDLEMNCPRHAHQGRCHLRLRQGLLRLRLVDKDQ